MNAVFRRSPKSLSELHSTGLIGSWKESLAAKVNGTLDARACWRLHYIFRDDSLVKSFKLRIFALRRRAVPGRGR